MSKYKEQIDNMVWSFSRLQSWYNCKYGWKLTYLDKLKGENNGWAHAGSFAHELLEDYANGKLKADQLEHEWLLGYDDKVTAPFPDFAINLHEHYKYKVAKYFKVFKGFSGEVEDVELEFLYDLPSGRKFKGYIDLITSKDDEVTVVDHKISKKFTKKKLKEKQLQMQMYAPAIKDKYDKYPSKGFFHFVQTGESLSADMSEEGINNSLAWADFTIDSILAEELFEPVLDTLETEKEFKDNKMFCTALCGHRNTCKAKLDLYGIT